MNAASVIVLIAVILAAAAAVFAIHRHRASGDKCRDCSMKGFCRKD